MSETATLKSPKMGFKYQLSLIEGQKNCRILPLEHSAILLTCSKLPFVIKIFILSILEWPLKTGLTAYARPKPTSSATETILPLESLYWIACVNICK